MKASGDAAPNEATFNADRIPAELQVRPQWVAWKRQRRGGKPTKVPIDTRTGSYASVTDPATWSDFETARAAAVRFDGLGFVLSGDDGVVAGDLDACVDREGRIHANAREIIARLATYTELSPSRRGVRLLGLAHLPSDHPCRTGKIEVYSRARFVTVTGWHLEGTPRGLADISTGLHWLFGRYFRTGRPRIARAAGPTSTIEDHAIIEKALRARNGADFAKLWAGDWQALGYVSQSEADLALLGHLACVSACNIDPQMGGIGVQN